MSTAKEVTAEQLMSSPVVAVTSDHSLATAWEAMREHGVHHLLVLDEFGLAAVLDSRTVAARWPAGGPEAAHTMSVGELVRHGVRCVRPDEPASTVAEVMVGAHCDAVPVVTPTGVIVGLVTAADVVAAVARAAVLVAPRPVPARDSAG